MRIINNLNKLIKGVKIDMIEYEIKNVKLAKLKINPDNPRRISDVKMEGLIKKEGIIIDENINDYGMFVKQND